MRELVSLEPKNSRYANEYGLLLKRDRKKTSEAEKYFHIAMQLEPHNIIYKSNYGVLLFDNERYKESESYLKYCVITEPQNAFYNHMYALLLQRQHKFHESFEYHQKAIQLDYLNDKYKQTYNKLIEWYDQFPRQEKERMKRMYLEAESHAKHMEFDIAEPTFKKLVEKNPYNLVYVFRYAYVLQRLKKYDLAEKYYKMCLRIEGDHNICHGDYGLLLSKLKRYKEADTHYKKCLYTDPENWICRKNYAVSLEIRGRYKEAAKYFREALNINPNDRETNQRYHKLLDRIPKLRHQKQKEHKHVLKTSEKKPVIQQQQVQVQHQKKENTNNSGKKTRRRGRKKKNNGKISEVNEEEEYNRALRMIECNNIKGAMHVLKGIPRNNFKYGLEYCRCLRTEGLFHEAIKEYKRILYNNKHMRDKVFNKQLRHETLYELGKVYENEIIDLQLAAECFREAFELNCTNNLYREACQNCVKNLQLLEFGRNFSSEERKKMTMTFESANEYIKCKKYSEAKKLLENILLINPDYFLYNAKYALVLHRLKMYKLAEKYFRVAIAIDPTNSISRGVYGGMLFQLKRYDEAEQELKVCLAINPNNWICHQDYARLLEYKNDLKSAAFHSKKAFEINPSDHESYQRYQYLLKKIEKEKESSDSDDMNNGNVGSTSSPRSNYSNNFALSPTRTIISVSGKVNKDPISLSSMYSYDNEFTTPPPSANANGRNDSSTPTSTNTNNSHMLNWNGSDNNGFRWNDFDTARVYIENKNYILAEPILNELVLSLEQFNNNNNTKIPMFDVIHLYGICLFELNKFEEAMKYYKMALIYNTNNCECNFKYAKLLKKFEHFQESVLYFEKCINGNGAVRPDYFYQYGLLLELMNDSNGAMKQFERAYYLKPDILKYKMKLDQIKLKEKNKTMRQQQNRILHGEEIDGIEVNSNSHEDEEKDCVIRHNNKLEMANKCIETCDWDTAKLLYGELLSLECNRNNFNYLYKYAYILRNLKLFKECIEYYELAIKINDTNALCFYEYGTVLHKELNNINKAIYQYEKALKLTNYKMYKCLFDYAIILQRKKRIKDALKYFKKAISELKEQNTNDTETLACYYNKYGLLLRTEKQYLLANEQFKLAIAYIADKSIQKRNDFEANYAYSLFLNERYKESEVKILKCLEIDEDNAFVNHVYALLLRRTNRFAEAFQYHHKAIQLNPSNKEFKKRYDEFLEYSNRFSHDEKQKMKRKFDRSQQMIKTKHFEKARVLLKQLSTVNPYNIVYVFKFAFVLHRLKQYKEAEKYYKMALNVEGDHSICHFDYGLMLSKLRRLEEAQYHYKRCLHMNPSDWICHINYARLLEKKSNFKDAAYHLEKALEINPNDAEAHQCYSQVVKKLKQQKHWTKKEQQTSSQSPPPNGSNNGSNDLNNINKSPWRRVTVPSPKKLTDTMNEQIKLQANKPTKAPIRNRPIYNLKIALDLYEKKEYIKCKQMFIKLLEGNDANNYECLIGYARCLYFGLKEFEAAEVQYKLAENLNKSDDKLYYELCLLSIELNKMSEAIEYIRQAIEIPTGSNNIEYNYKYGVLLEEELNDMSAATIYYEKCLEMCDDSENGYKDIRSRLDVMIDVNKYISIKDYQSAKHLLYSHMRRDNYKHIVTYANILFKLLQFTECEEYYKIALSLMNDNTNECECDCVTDEPLCYYNLGIICEQNGHRNEESLMYLEKAAALSPDNSEYINKYNESVIAMRKNRGQQFNNNRFGLFSGSLFDIFSSNSRHTPDEYDDLTIDNKPFDDLTIDSKPFEYFNSYCNNNEIIEPDEYDDEKINLNGIADDIFGDINGSMTLPSITGYGSDNISDEVVSSINEEKTVEETQHQSYCEKQRRLEFRLFLQEKVQFATKHFDAYFRSFVDKGLADIRMVPYLDELTLNDIGMIKPHQKLMLSKIKQFQNETKLFENIFKILGIPQQYFNNFGDYGICTIQSFCNNFKNKSDLRYIMDNKYILIDQLWQQIQITINSTYNQSYPIEGHNNTNQTRHTTDFNDLI